MASRNRGKVREIRKALKGLGLNIRSLDDFPGLPEVEEDGRSYSENALKKGRYYARLLHRIVLSDDSGIEVDALGGRPSVYSARYAGEKATSRENNQKLLEEMKGVPRSRRRAAFKCVIAVVSPDGREAVAEGSCRGKVGFEEVGKRGFGYDPLFVLPRSGKTMAQLTMAEKNRISHRGKALRKVRRLISTFTRQIDVGA